MVLAARARRIPLLQIICDLQHRASTLPLTPPDHSAPTVALHLLQSPVLHRDLGLSVPLSQLDCVTLSQLVPILQLSDGYINADIQETLIASFMPRSELDWLMHITDAFREISQPSPATLPSPPPAQKGGASAPKANLPHPRPLPNAAVAPLPTEA